MSDVKYMLMAMVGDENLVFSETFSTTAEVQDALERVELAVEEAL